MNTAMALMMTVMMILMKVLRLIHCVGMQISTWMKPPKLEYVDACSAPEGYLLEITDFIDGNPLIHPDASGIRDGIDNNCDEQIDGSDG